MKRKILFLLFVVFFDILPSYSSIKADFNNFYLNYIEQRYPKKTNMETLNLLNEISQNKIEDIENYILNSKTEDDLKFGFFLIDEEYSDLMENLNFELNSMGICPLKKRAEKKLKKAHKKYMRLLKKCFCIN